MAHSALTHKSISSIWIVWSTICISLGFLLQDAEEFAVENEDIFMQINNLSISDEPSEAKEDSNKDENEAIITNLGMAY